MESLGLQAVTLTDGSTAYIQQTLKDGKFVEGQTIQLEDGTTAYIHQVTVQKEVLPFEDGQVVQLEDGSTAFIHHTPKDGYDPGTVEAVELEDGTTAYIHHSSSVQGGSTILTVQTEADLEGLAGEDGTVDAETINALEQYANKTMHHLLEEVRSNGKGQQVGEKAFRCGVKGCGRLYTTAHHLKVHERAHTGDRPYKCQSQGCGKAFATVRGDNCMVATSTVPRPQVTHRPSVMHARKFTCRRPFKCPFEGCGRSFTTSNIRKVHIRTHTGERPYMCPEPGCGRGFASATNYKNHMRIHTGEKPYVCTVPRCGKSFTEYSSLYKHHVVHTHCKPYTCNHCGKTYRQTSTLAMHKRSVHGEVEATEESEQALYEQQQQQDAAAPEEMESPEKQQSITFLSGVEDESEMPAQVTMVSQAGMAPQVALITQEGGQQVSLTQEDLQALGTAITMVTQDGTTIAVPGHEGGMESDTHTVTMVTADGSEAQPVAIVTSEGMLSSNSITGLHHQQVALVATANGTQIAVQLEEQQTLEEAISMATAAIQQGGEVQETAVNQDGC
uniref:Zinc finger protein 76 n=1 Tax=Latimeria chalumnae TaxID=7897 RepID=H3B6Q9_LATCH